MSIEKRVSSRPVSRVLYGPALRRNVAAIHLGPGSHRASCNQPGWPGWSPLRLAAHAIPIRSCSRWGLPCHRRCRRRGALLPHLFTLTVRCPAVSFLWHFPWGRPRRPLAATVSPWSPDFPRGPKAPRPPGRLDVFDWAKTGVRSMRDFFDTLSSFFGTSLAVVR